MRLRNITPRLRFRELKRSATRHRGRSGVAARRRCNTTRVCPYDTHTSVSETAGAVKIGAVRVSTHVRTPPAASCGSTSSRPTGAPAFIKLCAYFPYPGKVWVNGHEWAKRQAVKAGIGFTELSNGFASCDDPAGLQEICDRLGPGAINVFLERWWARLPLPFDRVDREAGYWWEVSMRQVETSRTLVFDAPRRARAFFEALCADNLVLGRPDNMEIVFDRRVRRDTVGEFRTAIDRDNDVVVINAFYKHSRFKQYLKDGRALRIETVVNDPNDLGIKRRLEHLEELNLKRNPAPPNGRLLRTERVGQCVLRVR